MVRLGVPPPGRPELVAAVLSCMSYAACSALLSLANKAIFSAQKLNYPWSLLGVQSVVCALALGAYYAAALRRFPLRIALLRELLLPCSVFTFYIFTNARALRHISLPILSVIKSLAPMGIAAAERALFGEVIAMGTYGAMGIMLVANAVTVRNDIEFNAAGYVWALGNTVTNILYIVSLRYCVSAEHKNGEKALHLNVLLSLMIPPLALASGELPAFFHDFARTTRTFQLVFVLSCVLAAGIGASVFWVISATSGSTLSFVGAANKVVVIILGAVLFEVHISPAGWGGIALGVLGSIAFTASKTQLLLWGDRTPEGGSAGRGAGEKEDEQTLFIPDKEGSDISDVEESDTSPRPSRGRT
jgi:drug/metabolite transporter (DMT)-like permease